MATLQPPIAHKNGNGGDTTTTENERVASADSGMTGSPADTTPPTTDSLNLTNHIGVSFMSSASPSPPLGDKRGGTATKTNNNNSSPPDMDLAARAWRLSEGDNEDIMHDHLAGYAQSKLFDSRNLMAPNGQSAPTFTMCETDLSTAFAPFGVVGGGTGGILQRLGAMSSPMEGHDSIIAPIGHRSAAPAVNCGVCTHSYDDPKVLACFHSFCRNCLHVTQPDNVIICPKCTAETQLCPDLGIDSLLHDYGLANMLRAQKEAAATPASVQSTRGASFITPPSTSSSPELDGGASGKQTPQPMSCQGCKSDAATAPAVAFCEDCTHLLCAACNQEMTEEQKAKMLSGKATSPARETNVVQCYLHRSEPMSYFCFTCNLPVCRKCIGQEHAGVDHQCKHINDIAESHLATMHSQVELAVEKALSLRETVREYDVMRANIHANVQKAHDDIEAEARRLVGIIDQQRQRMLLDIDVAYKKKYSQMESFEKKLARYTDNLDLTINFSKRLLQYGSVAEVLVFKQLLETRMAVMLQYQPDLQPLSRMVDVGFVPTPTVQAAQAIHAAFGQVHMGGDEASLDPDMMPPIGTQRPTSRGGRGGGGVNHTIDMVSRTIAADTLSPNSQQTLNMQDLLRAFSESNLPDQQIPFDVQTNSMSFGGDKWSTGATDGYANANRQQRLPASLNLNEFSPTGVQDLQIHRVDTSQSSQRSALGGGGGVPQPQQQTIVNQSSTGSMYPPRSHIKRHKMIYHCKFGEFGVVEGQFTEPSGVSVGPNNDIFVADTNNHRIQAFDASGKFKFQFGECGKRDNQLLYPNRVAVSRATGDIIVTERSPTHQIQVYNMYGQFVRKFGANVLQHPRGVCVDHRGQIVVVECKVMRILVFKLDGTLVTKFSCSRYLEFPNGVATNDKDEIFVSDNRAHCVKVFNYQGQLLRSIGGEGVTNYPIGVGINHMGHVVVADNHNNFNLTTFTQDGQLVSAFESKVKHAQCFDVALTDEGSVVLASKDYRLYLYRYMDPPSTMSISRMPAAGGHNAHHAYHHHHHQGMITTSSSNQSMSSSFKSSFASLPNTNCTQMNMLPTLTAVNSTMESTTQQQSLSKALERLAFQ